MISRKALLQHLIHFDQPISKLIAGLRLFEWDAADQMAVLTRENISIVLKGYLATALTAEAVECWANALECREDIGFEQGYEDALRSIIHQLANPLLTSPLDTRTGRMMLVSLKD